MLEGQLAFILNKYLGQYVSGLDSESLRISVWKGDIVLKNLQLRPEALDAFKLPITVKAGILGTLRLKVRVQQLCLSNASLAPGWQLRAPVSLGRAGVEPKRREGQLCPQGSSARHLPLRSS